MKNQVKSSVFMSLALLMLISMGTGCASTRQTTTTQTTVQSENSTIDVSDEPIMVVEKSTTTTTEITPKPRGFIGGVFHVVGSVIALPFILIGGLFRMIF